MKAGTELVTSHAGPSSLKQQQTSPKSRGSHPPGHKSADKASIPGKHGARSTAAQGTRGSELPLVFPELFPKGKFLVEVPDSDVGLTDLSGDAGAVGRLVVQGAHGEEASVLNLSRMPSPSREPQIDTYNSACQHCAL